MTDLRAACIHGRYEKHQAEILYETQQIDHGQEMPTEWPCPGGREVTDDEILGMAGTIIDIARTRTQAAADRLNALVSGIGDTG